MIEPNSKVGHKLRSTILRDISSFDIRSYVLMSRTIGAMVILVLGVVPALPAKAQLTGNGPIPGVNLVQRLKSQVPVETKFVDENGKAVKIEDYCKDKPVVLNLI